MKELYGVTIAMTTPFDGEGKVDVAAIEKTTDALIKSGVDCLYPCGTTGEMSRLTIEERKKIAETVVRAADKRVTVFIHVGADDPTASTELARHAAEIGADGVGIVTPLFLHVSDRELEEYYLNIASQLPSDFPIYLYNIPQCAANDLTAKTAKTIYQKAENVVGIKYSFLDMNRTAEYLNISDKFSVLHGSDKFFSSLLVLGCRGTVSGVGGVFPEPFVRVYDAYKKGNIPEMQHWQKAAREICDILKCGSNMAYFKSGLDFRGLNGGHMRRPQLDLSEAEKSRLYKDLSEFCKKYDISEKI